MRTILFIDDLRFLNPEVVGTGTVTLARSSGEALTLLQTGQEFTEVWFDHDLGGEDTTRRVALWLEERAYWGDPYPLEAVYLHTANGQGRAWLRASLSPYYPVTVVDPLLHTYV